MGCLENGPNWAEGLDWADRGDIGGLPLEFGLGRIRPLLGRADCWTGFAATGPCWAGEPLDWASRDLDWATGSGLVRWIWTGPPCVRESPGMGGTAEGNDLRGGPSSGLQGKLGEGRRSVARLGEQRKPESSREVCAGGS
ncbi:hypothetical protein CDL15_Pgr022930 [Punica granatum]|uniref:Uncharacterized protein n=1 Tax=Punica granatum TaxID=22663 RepID=A0A218X419_PUNGR|nr:hypothetical protein CDL15_Pgr022930 [Punica granatum]